MATLSAANTYFQNRLWTDQWDNSSDTKKETALAHAEGEINSLSVASKLSNSDYNRAVYEQTLFLLNLGPEDRKRLNLQSQGVKSISISGSVSETYVLNGIPYASIIQSLISKNNYQTGEMI